MSFTSVKQGNRRRECRLHATVACVADELNNAQPPVEFVCDAEAERRALKDALKGGINPIFPAQILPKSQSPSLMLIKIPFPTAKFVPQMPVPVNQIPFSQ